MFAFGCVVIACDGVVVSSLYECLWGLVFRLICLELNLVWILFGPVSQDLIIV